MLFLRETLVEGVTKISRFSKVKGFGKYTLLKRKAPMKGGFLQAVNLYKNDDCYHVISITPRAFLAVFVT